MSSNKAADNNKTTMENVNDTVEAAIAMGKEKVEQVQENYTRAYGEFSKFSQETLGVYIKAGEIFAKGAEDIGQAYFKLAKITAETNADIDITRRSQYGSWQEQMEMIYKDQKNGTSTFKDHCDKVRLDNPKE